MLTYNFTRLLKARGIEKPFSYLVKAGYSGNFATKIANDRVENLKLTDIERLCVLFQCTPNDLFQWYPSGDDKTNDKHPLIPLKRGDQVLQLTKLLHSVPLDKLEAIENVIRKELEK